MNFNFIVGASYLIKDDVITFLSAALPRQTSVFVVFALQEESIHVLSMDVNSKYSIVREMRSELVE